VRLRDARQIAHEQHAAAEADARYYDDRNAQLCKHCGETNGQHDSPMDGGKNPDDPSCPGFEASGERAASVGNLSEVLERSIERLRK